MVADVIFGLGYVCTGAWALVIGSLIVVAIRDAGKHRRTHRDLGLPATGWFETCPMCVHDLEVGHVSWPLRVARDQLRARLKQQEFKD